MLNDKQLQVESVNFLSLEDAKLHHTDRFEMVRQENPTMVLRRGQPFHITISFSGRNYDSDKDILKLNFTFGKNPRVSEGTQGVAEVTEENADDVNEWHAQMVGKDEDFINIQVRSPADIPVGQWKFYVESKLKDNPKAQGKIFRHPDPIYLLFNPWVEEDQVYMSDESLLDEYVLNDVGKIWVGTYKTAKGREWVFGQFDAVVLPAIELMMDRVRIPPANRGNPIYVARAISNIVNANDALGVVIGNWSENYNGGVAPGAWTGSVPILEKYLKTKLPVKYGQCWVFAGVVNTVCRALGIPSRVVSNFVSAHDRNTSLTIDFYFSKDGTKIQRDPNTRQSGDSIWNFHVWNDAWMARPDLPKSYGGWQAIDATPQEESNGMYQCGPASVEAIRIGMVGLNYDVPFVLAAINADVLNWVEDSTSDSGYSIINTNKTQVGRMLLTKKPWIFDPNGDRDREDVTDLYKNREGTIEERINFLNAVRSIDIARRFYNMPQKTSEEFEFELVDLDEVKLGEPFSVTVSIYNKSEEGRTVDVSLLTTSVYYTGIKAEEIKRATGEFKISSMAKQKLRLTVQPEEYMDKLVEYCNMKINTIATVLETKETWGQEDDFQILKPTLDMKVIGTPSAGTPCTVRFSFQNPLKRKLTGCKFQYEGPGLVKNATNDFRDILPEEEVEVEYNFTPQRVGNYILIGTFVAKELVDITGSVNIKVLENEE